MIDMAYTPLQEFVDKLSGVSRYEAPLVNPKHEYTTRVREAIAHNESRGVKGDPYMFSRESGMAALGKALGRYQITEGELKTFGPKYLGQNVSAEQFLKSRALQDNYMNTKIAKLSEQGYTPENIADIHRAGFTNSGPPGYTNYQNAPYVKAFKTAFGAAAP